jgi:hypothetical protein
MKVLWHLRFQYWHIKPAAHVLIQPDAVHVVVERLVQRFAEAVVVDAGRVDEFDIVGGKADPAVAVFSLMPYSAGLRPTGE